MEPALNTPVDLLAPDDLVREMERLPSSARVLPRLMQLLKDPQVTLQDVEELILLDAGTAGKVMQIGNSAYYHNSRGSRGLTIQDSIGRVGLVKIFELVSYAATQELLLRALRTYGLEADAVWQMSVSGAIAAERVAGYAGLDAREAYTIGLLHSVGLIAMDAWAVRLPRRIRFVSEAMPIDWADDEKRQFGFSNASVAAALLRQWAFPLELSEPIRWQYNPALAHRHRAMAAVIHAAKWLRDVIKAPPDHALPELPAAAVLEMVPITPEALTELVDEVRASAQRVSLVLAEPAEDPA